MIIMLKPMYLFDYHGAFSGFIFVFGINLTKFRDEREGLYICAEWHLFLINVYQMSAVEKLPAGVIESKACYFWLEADGILVILCKPVTLHTRAHAEDGVGVALDISAGIPRPLLIDISDVRSMSRDAREIYAKISDEAHVKAVGLVTRSAASRILGNFFMSFNRPSVPLKLFNNADAARKWLLNHV